jgi:hypothetical protein
MPLAGTEKILGAQMFAMVQAELASDLAGASPQALMQLQKLCNGLANAIVPHIVTMTQVAPGIPTAGSPASQLTVGMGTLL